MKTVSEKIGGSIGLQMALLLPICVVSFFVHLSAAEVNLMEARNFVAAREMVQLGNWWTPTLNGEIRISKPPLPTWLTALVRIAGGNVDNNRIMRLPAAVAACLLVLSIWGLTRIISGDGQIPFLVAAILATAALVIIMGRTGSWDIYCHSFMAAAIWAFLSGIKTSGGMGRFILAGFLLSLSFMSKGPVAFYTFLLPFMCAYCLAFGCSEFKGKWKKIALALVFFLVLSSIWPLSIYYNNPVLSDALLSSESQAWINRHVRPFYFYGHFPLYAGIWLVVVMAGLMVPFAVRRFEKPAHYKFLLAWILFGLLLLTLFPEKKERYLLPAIIPMAVMAGYLFGGLIRGGQKGKLTIGDHRLMAFHAYLTGTAVLVLPILMAYFRNPDKPSSILWSTVLSLPLILIAFILFLLGQRRSVGLLFGFSVILVCLVNLFLLPVVYQSRLYWQNPVYQSLREARNIPYVVNLPTFHIGRPDPRDVWDIGKILKPLDVKNFCDQPLAPPLVVFADDNVIDTLSGCASYQSRELARFSYKPRNADQIKFIFLVESNDEQLNNTTE